MAGYRCIEGDRCKVKDRVGQAGVCNEGVHTCIICGGTSHEIYGDVSVGGDEELT